MPFAVVVNEFPDAPDYPLDAVRAALDLLPDTPDRGVRRTRPAVRRHGR